MMLYRLSQPISQWKPHRCYVIQCSHGNVWVGASRGGCINGELNVCTGGRGENCEQHSTTGYVNSLTRGDVGGLGSAYGTSDGGTVCRKKSRRMAIRFFFSLTVIGLSRGVRSTNMSIKTSVFTNNSIWFLLALEGKLLLQPIKV